MKVCEIFYSLQGESSYSGYPFVFVRLSGCPFHCSYCDSDYARTEGVEMSLDEILDQVGSYGFHPVLLTGGEPLIHPELKELLLRLLAEKRPVLVETSGCLSIEDLPPEVIKILDIKCPGSGEAGKNVWSNLKFISSKDEIKFVICGEEDYLFACDILNRYQLHHRCRILFSAAHGYLLPQKLAEWILRDHLSVQLQLQLHKALWPEKNRGV
ncbi:MAG: radical SAM protein [Syntrophales bacterium LBB04]|nr:radical SAM protein [Syntrophales bacterium LBB04]